MKKNIIKYVVVVLIMLVAGVVYSCSNKESISLTDENTVEVDSDEDSSANQDETYVETDSESEKQPTKVCVYVCGAVNAPGVYDLYTDQRVVDAIKAAGGFAEDADADYLNLADLLVDGEKIYVPTEEEVVEGKVPETTATVTTGAAAGTAIGVASGVSQKVNINTATIEELKTLNGIGDKRAQDIINYRTTHGNFNTIEDIKLVPGIKNAVFSKICDYIEV